MTGSVEMRILLLDGYEPGDADRHVVDEAIQALRANGHEVDRLELHGFDPVLSAVERTAYHSDQPVVSDDVRDSVSRLQSAEALLFCYRTVAFNVPASLKGWLERVMVPGVGFVFDEAHRVRRGLTNIGRIGCITTSPHRPMARLLARDGGKRTTARTIRLSCHKRCRTSFVSIQSPADEAGLTRVRKSLNRW